MSENMQGLKKSLALSMSELHTTKQKEQDQR